MTSLKRMLAACAAVLLSGTVYTGPSVRAFYDYKTYFTFNRSVELPGGRTLQPGKYLFRLVDSSAGRQVVQVLSEDETKMFATILAVEPRAETVIFADTPANAPRPIRYWYHSQGTLGPIGYEFVYPMEQAIRIAHVTNQPVLTTEASVNDPDALLKADVRALDPNDASVKYRELVRPQTSSTSAAALTREQKSPAQEWFDVARTVRSEVAGLQSLTLLGLTVLGGALVALRVHSRARRRPFEQPLELLRSRGRGWTV